MTKETRTQTVVAIGVSVASLVYSGSLAVQHYVPDLGSALMLSVDGVKPTYYLRVVSSLVIGLLAAWFGRAITVSERRLAWGTSLALGVSVVLVCSFP